LIVARQGHDDYDSFKENAEANPEATRAAFQAAEDEGERRPKSLCLVTDRSGRQIA
jgi:hypothetical protein